jgi:hypothetical protein
MLRHERLALSHRLIVRRPEAQRRVGKAQHVVGLLNDD